MPSEEKLSEPLSIIDIQSIDCGPNLCSITEHLNLNMEFTSSNNLKDGFWEVKVLFKMNIF